VKLHLHCQKCFGSNRPPKELDVNDDGYYEFNCECGHVQRTFYPIPRYELLLQFGMLALVDGHFRETVNSCNSALERFFEFYLRFVSFKRKTQTEQFDSFWRTVGNQSERQLGAYVSTYLFENSAACRFLTTKHFEFRNKVIHQGYIPSHDEALAFAQRVLNFIKDRVHEIAGEELGRFTIFTITELQRKHPQGTSSVSTFTVLSESLKSPLGTEFNLKNYLQQLKQFRNLW
jgi:hypothetical protein